LCANQNICLKPPIHHITPAPPSSTHDEFKLQIFGGKFVSIALITRIEWLMRHGKFFPSLNSLESLQMKAFYAQGNLEHPKKQDE
jgi:hypothetical protein